MNTLCPSKATGLVVFAAWDWLRRREWASCSATLRIGSGIKGVSSNGFTYGRDCPAVFLARFVGFAVSFVSFDVLFSSPTCTSFRFLPPAFCSFNTLSSTMASTGISASFAMPLAAPMVVIERVARWMNMPGTADALVVLVGLAGAMITETAVKAID